MRGYAIYRVILCAYIACLTLGIVGCSDSDGTVKTPIATPIIAPTGQFPHLPTTPSAHPFGTIDLNNEDATLDLGGEDGADSDDDVTVNKSVDAAAPAACDAWFVHCGDGFACVSGECVPDTTPPAPAETSTSEAGTVPDATLPTFISPPASLGEECTQDTTHCSEDFLCQPCAAGLVCNAKHQCAQPSAGDAGDACTSSEGTADAGVCGPGLTCTAVLNGAGETAEYRCAKYVHTGNGGFCNPDAGLLCDAGKDLVCIKSETYDPATSNSTEFGRCRYRAALGDDCLHAAPSCPAGTPAKDCPTAVQCFDGLVCTSEFLGEKGKCIAPCPGEQYAVAPVGHETVPLVVELYEKTNFEGHKAVVATTEGIHRDWNAFKTSWLKNCQQPIIDMNYVWCLDTAYEKYGKGEPKCTDERFSNKTAFKKAQRWCRREHPIPAILPEKIDKKARSIRVLAGPNYVSGDVAHFYDNVFGYGHLITVDTDSILGDRIPLFSMTPGECADITKPETCSSITLHSTNVTLKEKIRAVTMTRGVHVDYCATQITGENSWTKPIWAIVTVLSGKNDPITGKFDPRRTHLITDTPDLNTYMMKNDDGKTLDIAVTPGPDIGIGSATVIFYEKASWTGKQFSYSIGTANVGKIRSLKILPPTGNP